ncbi:hypothetical protein ABVN23_18810 [Pseudomonas fluorescens]|uniref:hypothetical protein n=1 Tax=Pseudomonas fluorescens TaxID=294 RepID=UPI003F98E662
MNTWLASIGVIATSAYATLIYFIAGSKIHGLQGMKLNEMGDFLAGVFGPVATLWLILGFFQQGYELRQNNKALMLQADELKNTVEQHKESSSIAERQLEAELAKASDERQQREKALLPDLRLHAMVTDLGAQLRLNIYISNQGNSADDLVVYRDDVRIGSASPAESKSKSLFIIYVPVVNGKYMIRMEYRHGGDKRSFDQHELEISNVGGEMSAIYLKFRPVVIGANS